MSDKIRKIFIISILAMCFVLFFASQVQGQRHRGNRPTARAHQNSSQRTARPHIQRRSRPQAQRGQNHSRNRINRRSALPRMQSPQNRRQSIPAIRNYPRTRNHPGISSRRGMRNNPLQRQSRQWDYRLNRPPQNRRRIEGRHTNHINPRRHGSAEIRIDNRRHSRSVRRPIYPRMNHPHYNKPYFRLRYNPHYHQPQYYAVAPPYYPPYYYRPSGFRLGYGYNKWSISFWQNWYDPYMAHCWYNGWDKFRFNWQNYYWPNSFWGRMSASISF